MKSTLKEKYIITMMQCWGAVQDDKNEERLILVGVKKFVEMVDKKVTPLAILKWWLLWMLKWDIIMKVEIVIN